MCVWCTHGMNGRSRITIYRPSHPYNAGTEHVGYLPTRQTWLACTKREAKREVSRASRVKGELHPNILVYLRTACLSGGVAYG